MQKHPNIQTKITAAFIAFFIIVTLEALVWYFVTQEILMKLISISERKRQGYDNTFIDILAMSSGFLLAGCILYGIIIALFSKLSSSMALKMITGAVTGLLPIICLSVLTFGIPISDPAAILELSLMAFAGGVFPFVQKKVMIFLQRDRV